MGYCKDVSSSFCEVSPCCCILMCTPPSESRSPCLCACLLISFVRSDRCQENDYHCGEYLSPAVFSGGVSSVAVRTPEVGLESKK